MKKYKANQQAVAGNVFSRLLLIACLTVFSQWIYAQNKQITGHVVDTKGEPAIGASILEKELPTEQLLILTVTSNYQ